MNADQFTDEIKTKLSEAASIDANEIERLLEKPRDPKMGDIALPCFVFAKKLRKAPQQIAADLAENLSKIEWEHIEKAQAVGPYLNFFYKQSGVAESVLSSILDKREAFGSSDEGTGKTVVIDYSSPNIAKPFGVGHLRSTVIGAVIYRIYEKLGYKCIGVNHLGDWGTQFGKLIVAYNKWGDEKELKENPIHALFELYTRFHREAEEDDSLEDDARREFKKLEEGNPEATAIWKRFKEYSLAEFERIYRKLGIEFDHYTGESFYNDKIDNALEFLNQKELTEVSQEALIVNLEEYDLGACLLKKGDDATLYATRDIAGILYRHNEFDFDRCLYVVGAEQSLHFKQVFKVMELAGFESADGLVHVPFGWIRFEGQAMSTRAGRVVFLDEVLEKATNIARDIILEKNPDIENIDETAQHIGVGAIIFGDISVRRNKDIDFRWSDALSFDGETGPYLQYAHARLCSLKRKFERELPDDIDFSALSEEEEKRVLMTLSDYPRKIKQAAEEYEPFVIASFLLDLAQQFNTFYQKHRIITDDETLSNARMALSEAVRTVLGDGLRILGIYPLERM